MAEPLRTSLLGRWWAKTYDIIRKDFDMYDLSIDGLNAALKKLMVNR